MLALQGVNILPQFLTFMLLSFIYFQVFPSQLFDRKKLQKLPAHGLSKSLTPRLGNSANIPRLSLVCRLCLSFQSREQKNSLYALPSSYGTHAQTLLFLFLYWNWHALLLKRCRISFWHYLLQVDCSRMSRPTVYALPLFKGEYCIARRGILPSLRLYSCLHYVLFSAL